MRQSFNGCDSSLPCANKSLSFQEMRYGFSRSSARRLLVSPRRPSAGVLFQKEAKRRKEE